MTKIITDSSLLDGGYKIIIFSSGGGGLLEHLIINQGFYKIDKVILNRDCGAAIIAKKNGLKLQIIDFESKEIDRLLYDQINVEIDLIVLAGFLPILSSNFVTHFKSKIINIHPSLLPKYGGKGNYGQKVQEKVLANGDKEAGCTAHFVNEEVDGGEIILQESISINNSKIGVQELSKIVHQLEKKVLLHSIYKVLGINHHVY